MSDCMRRRKTRNAGFIVSWLGIIYCVAPLQAESDLSDNVRISAKIFRLEAGGKEAVLAEPTVIASLGTWAKFRSGESIQIPISYTLPSIPKEAADRMGQSALEGKKLFTTNDKGVVIPAHPDEFETLPLGITARFRPRLLSNGNLVVDSEIENRKSDGWINYGSEILFEKAGPGGKKKKHVIVNNEQKMHVMTKESSKYQFVQKLGEDMGIVLPVDGDDPSATQDLKISIEAKRLPKPRGTGDPISANEHFLVSTRFIEVSSDDGQVGDLYPDNPVLSDAEFQMWIRKLSQRKGVDLLSAPSIVLAPGNDGRIEVVREFIYPSTYDPPELSDDDSPAGQAEERSFPVTPANPTEFSETNTGVSMLLTAKRAKKKGFVELTVEPEVVVFAGFNNFGQEIRSWQPPGFGSRPSEVLSENRIEMPVFETVSMETNARVPNGSSIVIGGVVREDIQDVEDKIPILGDLPLIGRLARSETEIHIKKKLLFVITVNSVDSAGLRD